jgi:hypothetical protein
MEISITPLSLGIPSFEGSKRDHPNVVQRAEYRAGRFDEAVVSWWWVR